MPTFHLQVWQANVPDFLARHLGHFPACTLYRHVADLKVDASSEAVAPQRAFELTQHGLQQDAPDWLDGKAVTLLHDRNARSQSVGDVFVLNGQAHGILGMGFRLLGGSRAD